MGSMMCWVAYYHLFLFNVVEIVDIVSYWGLLGAVCVGSLIGFFLCVRRYRNWCSIICNVLTVLECYTLRLLWDIHLLQVWVLISITVLLLLIYSIYFFREQAKRIRKRNKGTLDWILGMQKIVMCCLFLLFPIGILETNHIESAMKNIGEVEHIEKNTIEQHRQELLQLEDGAWETLEQEEKLHILQCIADIECTKLGLPHPLQVSLAQLEAETAGYYGDYEKII